MNKLQQLTALHSHPNNKGKTVNTLARIAWWKMNQLFFHVPVVVRFIENTQIICDPSSSYGSNVFYAGYPEYYPMKFIESYLKKTDIFIDVGANIGALTLIAATKATKGRVFSFEPTKALSALHDNIRLNNFTNVTTYDMVVSDKPGFEYFTESKEIEVSHIATRLDATKKAKRMKAVTLDSIFYQKKHPAISFLKIDVEGAELKVLTGARQLFAHKLIDAVLFEYGRKHKLYNYDFTDVSQFFSTYQFSLYCFAGNGLKRIDGSFVTDTTENILAIRKNSPAVKRVKQFL